MNRYKEQENNRNGDAMMQWVSVKERLPEPKHERYDVSCGGKWKESALVLITGHIDDIEFDDYEPQMITAICCYDEGDDDPYFVIPFAGKSYRVSSGQITHWMPLPKPPRKGRL